MRAFLTLSLLSVVAAGAARIAEPTPLQGAHHDLTTAARHWLDSLSPELRAKAQLAFDSPARTDWHFIPRTRPGVRLADMTEPQRAAARDLLRSALSAQGLDKVEHIIALDAVLRDLDRAAGGLGSSRDPDAYTFTIYGSPSADAPWGWKIEGHHISLNFTCSSTNAIAVTPAFLGANPAEVQSGPKKGERALAREEDLARQLLAALDDDQRKLAIIASESPFDILTTPSRGLDTAPVVGLPYSSMRPDQRQFVDQLLAEYAHNLRGELAEAELARIRDAGLDHIHFAWAGSDQRGQPHYYRLAGPTFVIEYDNTQDRANHIHTVWHDRERNFGQDALKQHYEHDHAK